MSSDAGQLRGKVEALDGLVSDVIRGELRDMRGKVDHYHKEYGQRLDQLKTLLRSLGESIHGGGITPPPPFSS